MELKIGDLLLVVLLHHHVREKVENETESHDWPEDEIQYDKVHEISYVW